MATKTVEIGLTKDDATVVNTIKEKPVKMATK